MPAKENPLAAALAPARVRTTGKTDAILIEGSLSPAIEGQAMRRKKRKSVAKVVILAGIADRELTFPKRVAKAVAKAHNREARRAGRKERAFVESVPLKDIA